MASTKPLTWLITGSSSGFGLSLARTILSHGHNVIATSRNPSRTPNLVQEIESSPRGKWITLDVTSDAATIDSTIKHAASLFGQIDVLVNNAGYAVMGVAEIIPEDAARAEFEVNFWGAVRVAQAVLPILRAQGSGTIVNISSIAGLTCLPSAAMYAASKHALEAWSESLSQEIAPLGIRVLVVEPGAFRTNFLASGAIQHIPVPETYKGTPAAAVLQRYQDLEGKQAGDPVKACERIVSNVEKGLDQADLGKIEKLRLPLGQDCYDRFLVKLDQMKENWEMIKDQALGLQIDE